MPIFSQLLQAQACKFLLNPISTPRKGSRLRHHHFGRPFLFPQEEWMGKHCGLMSPMPCELPFGAALWKIGQLQFLSGPNQPLWVSRHNLVGVIDLCSGNVEGRGSLEEIICFFELRFVIHMAAWRIFILSPSKQCTPPLQTNCATEIPNPRPIVLQATKSPSSRTGRFLGRAKVARLVFCCRNWISKVEPRRWQLMFRPAVATYELKVKE